MGKSVRLYLADDNPSGIITAEIINWTGHVISAPRTRLDDVLKREELKKTGVYIIYGQNFDDDIVEVYVGEGDDISARLRSHSKDENKEFWDHLIAVSSKDMNLTKAHVKYLEGQLITKLHDAKKCRVKNKTAPSFEKLPEADISDMDNFLAELSIVLPVIGVDFFKKANSKSQNPLVEIEQIYFEIKNTNKGIEARATQLDGEFVLLAGSIGDMKAAPSFRGGIQKLREQSIKTGQVEIIDGNKFCLLDDIVFRSPSGASVFLHGTSRNGRTDWMVEGSNKNYDQWETSTLEKA